MYRETLIGRDVRCPREGCRTLEARAFDASTGDRAGRRPSGALLIQAALGGDLDEVHRLVSLGTDVNFTNQYGVSALMVACLWERKDVVEFLLEQAADTSAVEYAAGSDALLYACLSGNADIVRLVLDGGAAVDTRNRFGRTPLMVAATVGNVSAVRVLVAKGADVNATDNSGTTALQIAMDQGFEEIAAVLLHSGTRPPRSSRDDLPPRFAEKLSGTGGHLGTEAAD